MAKKAAKSAKKKATSKRAKTAKKSAPRKSAAKRTAPKKDKKPKKQPKADKVKQPDTPAEVPVEQAADPLLHTQVDREVVPVQAEGDVAEPAKETPASTWEGQ